MIYDVKGGGGAIQLLILKPEELSKEKYMKFVEVLRIKVPNTKYVLCYTTILLEVVSMCI